MLNEVELYFSVHHFFVITTFFSLRVCCAFAALALVDLGIASTTARSTPFTDSGVVNTWATSGSIITTKTLSLGRFAKRFGRASRRSKRYSGRMSSESRLRFFCARVFFMPNSNQNQKRIVSGFNEYSGYGFGFICLIQKIRLQKSFAFCSSRPQIPIERLQIFRRVHAAAVVFRARDVNFDAVFEEA